MKSLKKNDAIKQFMVKTLVEKVGEVRMVERILEVMIEKFTKTTGEKTLEMMRKISGNGFKSDDKIDVMIDRFEDMVTERKKIKLEENLDYAMALQFLERLENSGKINAVEREGLREVIEDVEGNPKAGDTLNLMKKKLRKMKVSKKKRGTF